MPSGLVRGYCNFAEHEQNYYRLAVVEESAPARASAGVTGTTKQDKLLSLPPACCVGHHLAWSKTGGFNQFNVREFGRFSRDCASASPPSSCGLPHHAQGKLGEGSEERCRPVSNTSLPSRAHYRGRLIPSHMPNTVNLHSPAI